MKESQIHKIFIFSFIIMLIIGAIVYKVKYKDRVFNHHDSLDFDAYKITSNEKKNFKVYSFQGENDRVKINNGTLILSSNKDIINGGTIQYTGNKIQNIDSYSETVYFNKNGDKKILLSSSFSYSGENGTVVFPDDLILNKTLSETSTENLFLGTDSEFIKDNLYFSLNYSTRDGKKEDITLKLNVKEFNLNKDKSS